MITNHQKSIAQWAMDYALKNGCQSARVSILSGKNNTFEYRNNQLDKLQQSSENRFYIELFTDNRYGSFSTNRLEKSDLESFILSGIDSTRYLSKDIYRQLPDNKRYYKDLQKDLNLFDKSFDDIDISQKLLITRSAVEEILGTDNRIISISASYDDGIGAEYMIASNDLEVESYDSAFNLTVEVALKTDGDARPESYWYDSSMFWNELKTEGVAQKALQRALRKIGQKKIQSGKYMLLVDNTMSTRLLSPLVRAMFGAGLQQKSSFLLDKLGSQITSSLLTICDTPHIERAFGARWYDGEGVATENQTIINNGVLETYFIDTYSGLKMGVAPTISSPSIVNVVGGDKDFDGLLTSLNRGIWVTGFNGGNCNPTTGDFSFGVEGFLIENGQVSTPIGEMNITGNMLSLWQNLVVVGNDPSKKSSWLVPSLLFDEVNFSGL